MKKKLLFILMLFAFLPCLIVKGQDKIEQTENKVHSIFIYNFTKYINWPEEYNSGDFIVGVIGETDLIDELHKVAKSLSSRKVSIKKYKNLEELDKKCHILFLTATQSNLLSEALRKLKGKPTLVITHKDGLGKAGSLVNFVSENGKYKFEINMSALEEHRLKCAQQLKMLAIVI